MGNKRRDSKGRVLRNGEGQRADGKYMFRYSDADGERRTVYSWKLVETDKLPDGKRNCEALRTIEQKVLRDAEDGIRTNSADKTTVNMLYEDFMALRTELRESTRCNYAGLYNTHIRDSIGKRKISSIKHSDVYKLYMSLSKESNLKISSIQSINALLWQLFESAAKDDIIRRNPVTGVMLEVSRKLNEEVGKRYALTTDEQSELIDYIYKSDRYKKYGTLFTTLLGTGMRIGEALGLRWCDVDFKKGLITVDHSLSYKETEAGGYAYRINEPKTKAGIRNIPIFEDVNKALKKEKRRKRTQESEPFSVDGYTDFIFRDPGKVCVIDSV